MIYYNWFKFCSFHKHYAVYSQDWWLFKNLDWQWSRRFCSQNFGEYFKSRKEKLYSKVCKKLNVRKIAKLLDIFLATSDVVEKYAKIIQSNSSDNCAYRYNIVILNLFEPKLQLIITEPIFKNKLQELFTRIVE